MRWRDGKAGLARAANSSASLLLQGMMVLFPLLVLGLLWWGRNRGFDITDEGMYLLMSQHPEQVSAAATLVYVYLAPLFRLVGGNIGAFRVLGYLLTAGSALVLWYGARRLAGDRVSSAGAIAGAGMTVSGALLLYVWFLPTPSYNLMNAVAVYLFAGALLTGLAALDAGRQRAARIAWLLAGAAIGIGLFVKFPTAILLLLLSGAAAGLWPALSLKTRLLQFSLVVAGMLVWIGFHLVVLQSPEEAHAVFTRGLEYARTLDPRYTTTNAITRIFADSWALLIDALTRYKWIYLIVGAALVILTFLPGRTERRITRTDWLLGLAGGTLLYFAWSVQWYVAGVQYIGKIAPLVGGILILALVWRGWRVWWSGTPQSTEGLNRWRWFLIVLFLIGLPFAAAAGTNNPLDHNMALCMAPWFAAVWLIFADMDSGRGWDWLHWVVPAFLVGLCSAQVFTGCLKDPYRLRTGLAGQTVPTVVGPAGSVLYLDQATSGFLTGLRQAAAGCGIVPGTPVLAFYDMPGLVYAIGGMSPGIPWYIGQGARGNAATRLVLGWVAPATLKAAAILQLMPVAAELPDLGLSFPGQYRKCAQFSKLPFPSTSGDELTLWVPQTAGR